MSAKRRKRTSATGIVRPRHGAPRVLHLADRAGHGAPVERVEVPGERAHEVERERRDQEAHRDITPAPERVDHAPGSGGCGRRRARGPARRLRRRRWGTARRPCRARSRGCARRRPCSRWRAGGCPRRASTGSRPSGRPTRSAMARSAASRSSRICAPEEEVRVEVAQHQVGVGHGRLASRRDRRRPGRAARPRSRARPGAGEARRPGRCDPPPVPISIISITGTLIGSPLPFLKW